MEILAFVLSIFGTTCICTSSLVKGKNMKLILLLLFMANVLIATSYLLTRSYNGAVTCFVGAAQTIINYFYDRKNKSISLWLIGVYALSFVAINLIVFERLVDLVSMFAALTFVLCITQKNGKKYRLWTLANVSLWIIYDVACKANGPLTTHIIQLVMLLSGIMIHDVMKKQLKS